MSRPQRRGGGRYVIGRKAIFCINEKDIHGTLISFDRLEIRKFGIGGLSGFMGLFIDFLSHLASFFYDIPHGIKK